MQHPWSVRRTVIAILWARSAMLFNEAMHTITYRSWRMTGLDNPTHLCAGLSLERYRIRAMGALLFRISNTIALNLARFGFGDNSISFRDEQAAHSSSPKLGTTYAKFLVNQDH